MKKTIFAVGLSLLLGVSSASAQILWGTVAAGKEIGVSNNGLNPTLVDFDGNGIMDMAGPIFEQSRMRVAAPDANGVSRVVMTQWEKDQMWNPLTGKVTKTTAVQVSNLVFDDHNFGGGVQPWTMWGGGSFKVGVKTYFASMLGVQSWPVPAGKSVLVRGTKYIDGSLSLNLVDTSTGKVVRKFTVRSTPAWQLQVDRSHFVDINRVTYFLAVFNLRPKTAPLPVGKQVNRAVTLYQIWNFDHTKLIKQYTKGDTVVKLP